MKNKINMRMHNTYLFEVLDTSTGRIRQMAKAENTVVPQAYNRSFSAGMPLFGCFKVTAEENLEDLTNLVNPLWAAVAFELVSSEYLDDYTVHLVLKGTIPALSSYVGEFSCIGSFSSNYNASASYFNFAKYGISKALIKDAEGNVIKINKTDLDQITVTLHAYISISSGDDILEILPRCTIISAALNNWRRNVGDGMGALLGMNELYDAKNIGGLGSDSDLSRIFSETSSGTYDAEGVLGYLFVYNRDIVYDNEQNAVTKSTIRMARGSYNKPVLYNFLGINTYNQSESFALVKFPNINLLPIYRMSDMQLCVGDGETTHYELPIGYFLKDTEQIKIGETILIRDVDYTIDNHTSYPNNEYANPWSWATFENCYEHSIPTGSAVKSTPLFTSIKSFMNYQDYHRAGCMYMYNDKANKDLILQRPANTYGYPTAVNYFRIANLSMAASNSEAEVRYMDGLQFVLYSSDDKQSWIERARLEVPEGYSYDGGKRYSSFDLECTFDSIDAEYWKIVIDTSNAKYPDKHTAETLYGVTTGSTAKYNMLLYGCRVPWLGYKGAGINFTTPPAAGAIVMFNAELDRPIKNKDYVFDVSYVLQF